MKGTIQAHTLLLARLFEPVDKSLSIEFLKAHPVTHFPGLYKENKKGRRVIKDRLVTTAFVEYLVSALQAAGETNWVNFKYHDSGIGVGAEAIGDTALGTPWGGARSVGTQTKGATDNIYKSVATTTYTSSKAITEHGLFNASSGVTLMDRSVFSAINVVNGNQIEWTYELTVTAGG